MPPIDTSGPKKARKVKRSGAVGRGADTTAPPKSQPTVKAKAGPPKPPQRVSPSGDMVDRSSDHRAAPAPPPKPIVKERMFAKPNRPANKKVIRDLIREDERAKEKRAETRRVVKRMDARPTPSPDALDTYRSPQQKKRDSDVVAKTVRETRQRVVTKQGAGAGTRAIKSALDTMYGPGGVNRTDAVTPKEAAKLRKKGVKVKNVSRVGASIPLQNTVLGQFRDLTDSKERARSTAPALKVLEQTLRPVHAVANAAKHDVQQVKKHGLKGAVGHGSLKEAGEGFMLKDKTLFSDVLKEAGVKNKVVTAVAGTALDIGLDPTTYLTAGTGSVARKAATTAAKKTERKVYRSVAAKEAGEKAAAEATRRGASAREVKLVTKTARHKHARRAGKKAGTVAAAGKPTNNGLSVRFGGREVPGVTRATSAAKRTPRKVARVTRAENTRLGKAVDRAQQKVRDTSRNATSDFNPAIAPAGVDREAYQAARRAARTARAGAQRGTFKAGQRAVAFRKAVGKENFAKVIDAIETGKVAQLPKELRSPAHELQRDFAKMRKAEVKAGLKVGTVEGYVKHLRLRDPEPGARATPGVGSRQVRPSFGKSRIEGTIKEKNAAEPGAYSEDIADIYLNRGAESAVARSKAKLNQRMVEAGRKPDRRVPVKEQVRDNEALFKIEGSDLVKVDLKSAEARNLPKGRYVILNEKLISRTRGTVAAAAERSTTGVFFDKAQGVWKLTATQVNPGYHVRNFVGEGHNAYLKENPVILGRNAVQAARALRQLGRDEDALRVLGKKPKEGKYTELVRDAEKVGAVRAGQLGREVGDMLSGASKRNKPKKARRGVLRKPGRVLKNVEDVFRLATYKGGIDRGLPPEKAMERASRNHFDYGDLTAVERNVMRRIAPFWTFSARNIPLQARTLLTNPGKFANYQKIREELQKAFDIPDDWDKDQLAPSEQRGVPFPVKINGKTYNIGLGPSGLPLTDLNEFPSTGDPLEQIDEWGERAASMLTPFVKTPVELWANMSYFFREPIERESGPLVPAPSWVSHIPAKYRKDLGITQNFRDPRSGKSGWGAPAKLVYALGVLPGPIAFGNRVMTDSERPGQSKTAKTIGYLGPRIRENDPLTVGINRAYEEKGRVTKAKRRLEQQNKPGTENRIGSKNPTPAWTKLAQREKDLTLAITQGRIKRGDKGVALKVKKPKVGFDFDGGGKDFDFSGGAKDFDFGG